MELHPERSRRRNARRKSDADLIGLHDRLVEFLKRNKARLSISAYEKTVRWIDILEEELDRRHLTGTRVAPHQVESLVMQSKAHLN